MNEKQHRFVTLCIAFIFVGWLFAPLTATAMNVGDKAPSFQLKDINGVGHALAATKGREMTVLYFFDSGSRSNQEGLLMLDSLLKRYKDTQLTVWGITRSPKSEARSFAKDAALGFPVLLDDQKKVAKLYKVGPVLPVVCTLGPELTVIDYFQGGGKSAEIVLVRLAERQLNRNQPQLALALGAAAARKNPDNTEALAVQGYAALKQGKVGEAEKVFNKIAAKPGKDALAGKEGQAAVKLQQGQIQQAMALVDDVTRNDPQRAYAHKLKGDLLAEQGDTRGAQKAYEQAVRQPVAADFQKAEANNQLGRVLAYQGQYDQAREYYDQAITLDPYYLEPTSNKGVAYEREGMWTQALGEYRRALVLDQNDTVAAVLARKAEQMLSQQKDTSRQDRIRKLVKDLAERFQKQTAVKTEAPEDTWTSRPMVVTFIDMKESGGLSARDGLAMALSTRLGELLKKSGRVQVVDRALIEQLLQELNLGTSELADPATALRLGRILAAKLIGTGSLMHLPDSTMLNLRLIDTETSAVAKTVNRRIGPDGNLDNELFKLNRDILRAVMETYPLQGFVIEVDAGEVMLNLGGNQGVTTGSAFNVVEGGKTIKYKGRVLQREAKSVAQLEVVRVEPDLCFAKIVKQQRPLASDDKVKEVLTEAMVGVQN